MDVKKIVISPTVVSLVRCGDVELADTDAPPLTRVTILSGRYDLRKKKGLAGPAVCVSLPSVSLQQGASEYECDVKVR